MNTTHTYFLYYLDNNQPVPFYVGESQDPEARFKRHQRDAKDPLTTKEAYVFLRDHSIADFFYEVVPDKTEAQLVEELTKLGCRLYNSNRGIGTAVKKQRDLTFAKLNRQADETIERKNLMYGKAQQLSKSEVVAARINEALPDETALLEAKWVPCPGELIPARPPKTAQYIRWGDYRVVIGGPKEGTFRVAHVLDTKLNRTCGMSTDKPLPLERFAPLLARTLKGAIWSDQRDWA